ncbi:MAG: D-alanine--D-alanine ligase [Bacteroidetes bacterium GWF2_43_63]|nr:MAG: D-alanine--D-alanine ligase [Bacteroidetes bacterium GWE2_42_42]OFY54952.1 MAG: D-alanine--D-alanine ligase [Bacteroidetes bacterium GWF2_43_63]HCB63243.1 D-alanine--D-alanine ligase [Bacteroidales bacterium]HCY21985.1 D-alanine--D-alanine ligase [Bacteroidales bacterium]
MKLNIALLAGGYSGESVISVQSAGVIAQKIDRDKYNVFLIEIGKENWTWKSENGTVHINRHDFSLPLPDGTVHFDVAFIMIHGTPGENGLMQSYFELLGIPHTTCNAMVSNVTFNKFYTIQLVKALGVIVGRSVYFNNASTAQPEEVWTHLNFPVFVKPNSGGSSIGMSKVKTAEEVAQALEKAFQEDKEVLVEEFTQGDELTCGVLRINGEITALPVTLVKSKKDFFDFEAKYTQGMSDEITPAPVDQKKIDEVVKTSKMLYEKLNCRGVVRFDYIHNGTHPVFLEVNTIPGMSSASIVPQQARAAGIQESELYDIIIENALKY